ncbi:hypothetical protein [Streptomyces jumonjinensis]|uniref:Uncharacterized protein n=1 Tax=Streptomyces jumonjinensis TaxID=1945 RepID=A0A646KRU3_STRJU|nr:hypothetical protein [Streptomyces jumonjinensis]MQT05054.1 hypothetical protein [Streptomyces jumonjinensis]
MTDWQDGWPAGTADDLVDDARALGISYTRRAITDYVEVGLLASPVHRKSTQRGSDARIFPPAQRRLFYELNRARLRSALPRVPRHTMIPIVLFMWCTDDTVVTDSQARRALRTYARSAGVGSDGRRRETARKVVEQFAHPLATPGQRQVAAAWIRAGEKSRNPRWDPLADALSTVASPWRSRGLAEIVRGVGPAAAPMTTDQVVAMWELAFEVNQRLAIESVDEAVLRHAREEHRRNWEGYQAVRLDWKAQAGPLADIFEMPDDQEQAARQHVRGFESVLGNTLGLARPAFQRAEARARARLR